MLFRYPQSIGIDYGNKGIRVDVGQEGGPQGYPSGSFRPLPTPAFHETITLAFGMALIPAPYGSPIWIANRFTNNRIPRTYHIGEIKGLVKNPVPFISF